MSAIALRRKREPRGQGATLESMLLGSKLGLHEKPRRRRGLQSRGGNVAKSVAGQYPYLSTSGVITPDGYQRQVRKAVDAMIAKSTNAFTTTDLAAGGKLLEAQAAFIFALIKHQPTILRDVRMVGLQAKEQRIDRMHFPNRILHAATEGAPLADNNRSKPAPSKIQMSAKDFKAEVRLTYESLEQNVNALSK